MCPFGKHQSPSLSPSVSQSLTLTFPKLLFTLTLTHSLSLARTCRHDVINGIQDLKIYSHADSLILSHCAPPPTEVRDQHYSHDDDPIWCRHAMKTPIKHITKPYVIASLGCYVGGALLLWIPEQVSPSLQDVLSCSFSDSFSSRGIWVIPILRIVSDQIFRGLCLSTLSLSVSKSLSLILIVLESTSNVVRCLGLASAL